MKKESKGFTCFLNKPVASFFYATTNLKFLLLQTSFEFIKFILLFNLFLFKENAKKIPTKRVKD